MTGRDLIIYILKNKMENVDVSKVFGIVSIEKTAEEMDVGVATIKLWCVMKYLDTITIDDKIYIFKNEKYEKVKSWEEI